MSIKKLAAAAAFVAVSPAFASIATGANGELFLAVFDDVNKVSYIKDLGIYQNDFKAAADSVGFGASSAADAGYSKSFSIVDDSYWNTFVAASTPANLKWTVMALDNTGGTQVNGVRLFTTAKNTSDNLAALLTYNNNQFSNGLGSSQIGTLFSALNQSGSHGVSGVALDPAINGSSVNFDGDAGNAYFGNPGSGEFLNNTAPFSNANAVGDVSQFFYLSRSPDGLASATVDTFANSQFNTMLSFNTAGGAPTLTISLASAVPEPSSYAMLLIGLLGMGLLVRRRQQR